MDNQEIYLFARAVAKFASAVNAQAEIESMKAENEVRARQGLVQAYDESAFIEVANNNRLGCNDVQKDIWG